MQLFPWVPNRDKFSILGKLNPRLEFASMVWSFSTICNHRHYQESYSLALDPEKWFIVQEDHNRYPTSVIQSEVSSYVAHACVSRTAMKLFQFHTGQTRKISHEPLFKLDDIQNF